MSKIKIRLSSVLQQIRAAELKYGRFRNSVQLMAVSKTRPESDIRLAYDAGQRCFGESYAQEAVAKVHSLQDLDIEWHFIGPIQSNKTKDIAAHFDWVHSVDRLKIAQRLNNQRPDERRPLNVCMQINVSNEDSKSGVSMEAAAVLAQQIDALPNLRLRGLMTVPAPQNDFEQEKMAFRAIRDLQIQLINQGLALDVLSMGMTNDMDAAIAEGSTIVRIGTAIFGARDYSIKG